jgi:hypothetical protein
MAQLASADIVRIRSQMGTNIRVTAVFQSDDEANAYMEAHPGEGVITEAGGMVWIGDDHDLGGAHAQ